MDGIRIAQAEGFARRAAAPGAKRGTGRLAAAAILLACTAAGAAAQTPTVTLTTTASLAEGDGATDVVVTATLSAARSSDTTVTLSLAGTARSTDYAVSTLPSITIAAASLTGSGTLVVTPVDDGFFEGGETIEVQGSAEGVSVVTASVALADNDNEPTLEINVPGSFSGIIQVDEDSAARTFSVSVTLTGATFEDDTTVTLAAGDGERVLAPEDYTVSPALPTTLTLGAGSRTGNRSLTFSPVDDSDDEHAERLFLQASATVGGATLQSSSTVVVAVVDNDDPLKISGDMSPREVNAGESTTVTFRAQASAAVPMDVTVTVAAPSRWESWFSPKSATITIASGETSGTGTFTVTPPSTVTAWTELRSFSVTVPAPYVLGQIFNVTVLPGGGAPLLRGTVNGFGVPVLRLGDSVDYRVQFDRAFAFTSGTLRARLDSGVVNVPCQHSPPRTVLCRYRVAAGDYDFDGIEFEPGALSLTWHAVGDSTVTWPVPQTAAWRHAINVYGGRLAVDLTVTPQSVQEGVGATTLTVTALNASRRTVNTPTIVVPFAFQNGTTTAADYTVSGTQSITIPAGQLEGSTTLIVTPVEDLVKESRVETVRLGGARGPDLFVRGAPLRIIDAPSVRLSASPARVTEGGGAQQVVVTAALGNATDQVRPRPIAVTLTLGGTAGTGDYAVAEALAVTIPANTRSGSTTLTVTPVDDRLLEGDETIVLQGSTAGLTVDRVTLTLVDNDATPEVVLAVNPARVLEAATGSTAVAVTATLDPSVMVSAATVVTLGLAGTATEGSTGDYAAAWSPASKQITIPAGEDAGTAAVTLTLTPRQDTRAEGDETIVVQGRAVVQDTSMSELVVQVARITLEDDDEQGVHVTPTALEIDEGSTGDYTVRLASQPTGDVRVAMTTSLTGTDVSVNPAVLTFTMSTWATAQTVTVTAGEDTDSEADEPVTLMHSASGGGYDSVDVDDVVVTVLDDDTLAFTLAVAPAAIDEDGGTSTVTVSTGGVTLGSDETIALALSGTATKGTDYTVGSETLTLAAGETSVTTTVTAVQDTVDDDGETVVVTASRGGTAVGAAQTVTITDDDEPSFTVSVSPSSIAEAGGSSTVTVSTGGVTFAAARQIALALSGTATKGADYTVGSETLTLTAGSTTVTTTVTAVQDTLDDDAETVVVTAEGSSATVTITDDDAASFAVSVSPSSVAEAGGVSTVTVSTGGVTFTADRQIALSLSGTATKGADYTVGSETLTLTAGSTTVTTTVTAVQDTLDDDAETVVVTAEGSSATVTITDDDTASFTVSVSPSSIAEAGGSSTVTVSTGGVTFAAARQIALALSGTATKGADYTVGSETLTLTAGSTSVTTTVTAVQDTLDDDAETVVVTAEGSSATVTITDDDTASFAVSVSPASIAEAGGASTVTVSTGGATFAAARQIALALSGTATKGADYTVGSETLTLSAGETSVTTTVTAVQDTVDDDAETVVVTAEGAQATVTITDDDTASFAVSVAPSSIAEAGGSSTVTVSTGGVTFAAAREIALALSGTATKGTDYTVGSETLTLAAGETSVTTTVTAVQDTVDDDAETVVVTSEGSSATVTITDDDAPSFAVSVSPSSIAEAGGSSTVTVSTGGVTFAAARQIALALSGTATKGADYTVGSETLTLAAGETSVTTTVTAVQDTVDDDGETVVVTAEGSSATVTITDDDAPSFAVSVSPSSIAEAGGSSTVTVSTGGVTFAAARQIALALSGTATKGADYTVGSETLTLTAGSTSVTTTVTAVQDTVDDDGETVVVTAEGASATVTITDDDESSFTVSVSVSPSSIAEAGGVSTVTVSTGGVTFTAARQIALALSGTATKGADYTVGSETLTLAAGETSVTTTVTAVQDTVDDDAETVVVTAEGAQATITIVDDDDSSSTDDGDSSSTDDGDSSSTDDDEATEDDTAGVWVEPTALEVEEGGSGTYAVVLRARPAGDVEVAVTGAGAELTVSPSTLTFTVANWSSAQVVTVEAAEDDDAAPDEELLTHTVRGGGYDGVAAAAVAVTVVDDDLSPVSVALAVEPAELGEGAGASAITVTATLSDRRASTTAVALAVRGGTATAEDDYAAAAATLTIGIGETRGRSTLMLTPVDDGDVEPDETVTVTGASGGLEVTPATLTIIDDDGRNHPPSFTAGRYRFDLEEGRAGRPRGWGLGMVTAEDPDGDPVTYALAFGSRDRFAVGARSGMVTYVGRGEDFERGAWGYELRVEAQDPEGLSTTAVIVVTVLDVNEGPEAAVVIPGQELDEGGSGVTLELTRYFRDDDGDALTFEAASGNAAAVTVAVAGPMLTVTAVGRGESAVTVTARDPAGLTATQVFGVRVSDRWVRSVAGHALAAQARSYLSSARLTLGQRAESSRSGSSRVTVAGEPVPLGAGSPGEAWLSSPHSWQMRAAAAQYRLAAFDPTGNLTRPGPSPVAEGTPGRLGRFGGGAQDALVGTDFLLAAGGGPGADGGSGGRRRWTVWGQGDLQGFRGAPDGGALELAYDGDVRTWYMGVDSRLGERWLAGVAVARSGGAGTWRAGSATGRLATTMTAVHPYLRWARGDTTVWTLLGTGRGTLSNLRSANEVEETSGLGLGMGLVEARRRLATVGGGLQLGLRGEASWARLQSDAGDETIDALRADVHRTRVGLEVARELGSLSGLRLVPFGALSARWDGGAGQIGTGVEVAGGVRLTDGMVRIEAQARRLVLHTAAGYQEQGASMTARIGASREAPGLSLSLSPRWGAPAFGADSLWQDHVYEYGYGVGGADRAFDAQVGYGLGLSGGGLLLTPFGGYSQAPYGRRVQVGALLGGRGGGAAGPAHVELRVDRAGGSVNGTAHYRVSLVGVVTFSDGAPRARPPAPVRRRQAAVRHAPGRARSNRSRSGRESGYRQHSC